VIGEAVRRAKVEPGEVEDVVMGCAMQQGTTAMLDVVPGRIRAAGTPNSENSKANRIETMKGPAESGQICSVGRRKIAKKIAKNKRCYANTLRPPD
jgi:hypothetical protein